MRIVHAATGEIIRTRTINPQHRYHGTGKPVGGPRRPYGPYRMVTLQWFVVGAAIVTVLVIAIVMSRGQEPIPLHQR